VQLGTEDPSLELDAVTEKYNAPIHDFMMKLPGINLKNINSVMKKGKNLKEMLKMDENQLKELVGNAKDAKALWNSLHNPQKPKQEDPNQGGKFKKSYKRY
jgi:ERCC4-type nuclease